MGWDEYIDRYSGWPARLVGPDPSNPDDWEDVDLWVWDDTVGDWVLDEQAWQKATHIVWREYGDSYNVLFWRASADSTTPTESGSGAIDYPFTPTLFDPAPDYWEVLPNGQQPGAMSSSYASPAPPAAEGTPSSGSPSGGVSFRLFAPMTLYDGEYVNEPYPGEPNIYHVDYAWARWIERSAEAFRLGIPDWAKQRIAEHPLREYYEGATWTVRDWRWTVQIVSFSGDHPDTYDPPAPITFTGEVHANEVSRSVSLTTLDYEVLDEPLPSVTLRWDQNLVAGASATVSMDMTLTNMHNWAPDLGGGSGHAGFANIYINVYDADPAIQLPHLAYALPLPFLGIELEFEGEEPRQPEEHTRTWIARQVLARNVIR